MSAIVDIKDSEQSLEAIGSDSDEDSDNDLLDEEMYAMSEESEHKNETNGTNADKDNETKDKERIEQKDTNCADREATNGAQELVTPLVDDNQSNDRNGNTGRLDVEGVDEEEAKRREDRKRRNRESAAKCRQKLKDKLNNYRKDVSVLELKNCALRNEMQLLDIEFNQMRIEMTKHKNSCYINGIASVVTPNTSNASAGTSTNVSAWIQAMSGTSSGLNTSYQYPIQSNNVLDINNNNNNN